MVIGNRRTALLIVLTVNGKMRRMAESPPHAFEMPTLKMEVDWCAFEIQKKRINSGGIDPFGWFRRLV